MIELHIASSVPEEMSLVQRYWAMDDEGKFKENIASLLPFRNLTTTTQLGAFVRSISTVYDTNQTCGICGCFEEVTTRTEVKKSPRVLNSCKVCDEQKAELARQQKNAEETQLQSALARIIERNKTFAIDHGEITDDIALIVLAIDRAINPRLETGTFTRGDCRALVPADVGSFVTRAYRADVIHDRPEKAKTGTYFLKEGNVWHKSDQVVYQLTADKSIRSREEILDLYRSRPFEDMKAIRNLWLDYAASDCMSYFFSQCEQHSLSTSAEDDAEILSTLRNALETYSVAKLWSALWRVVRDASALSARPYYTLDKAAATLPGKLRRLLEKAAKDQASLRTWNRPEHQPAGTLGEIFMEFFNIDENTDGIDVMAMVDDYEQASAVADSIQTAAAIHEPAKEIFAQALNHGISAEVILHFAEAVRGGANVPDALSGIFTVFPQLKAST